MVAELVPERELQPRAFSIMPLVWSLGSVVGPSFGGFFAHPARQFPSVFGNLTLFKKFPYLLPNLVGGIFFTFSLIVATLFVRETLAGKREESDWGLLVGKRLTRAFRRNPSSPRRRSFVDGEATAPLVPSNVRPPKGDRHVSHYHKPPSTLEVFTPQTIINLAAYTFLAFHSVAFDQNVSVFLNYPTLSETETETRLPIFFTGGFGLESGTIGLIFTCYGITCGLFQFLLYPILVDRFGLLYCFKVCCK